MRYGKKNNIAIPLPVIMKQFKDLWNEIFIEKDLMGLAANMTVSCAAFIAEMTH